MNALHPRVPRRPRRLPAAAIVCVISAVGWSEVRAQLQITSGQAELQTVISARQALDEFSDLKIESIPPALLGSASGVAIFPNMIKGGFILGVNYGKGVLLARRPDGSWSPPLMVTMGGGSLGFQAGLQAADIVLVFATPRSLQGMLAGQKVTLGADASVALGPIGRQANAATDARMGAEIYSYARSRGLFAELIAEVDVVSANDGHWKQVVVVTEAGCINDDIGEMMLTVFSHNTIGDNSLNSGLNEFYVGLHQALQPRTVVLQHPLC